MHNGWSNYETWAVKLWMDNDEGDSCHWQERTQETWEEAEADRTFTRKERAMLDLADELKEWHDDQIAEQGVEGFAADLLNAAFGEVDWHEIAENMLEDVDDEEEEDEEE